MRDFPLASVTIVATVIIWYFLFFGTKKEKDDD